MKESGYFRQLENAFRGDPYDGRNNVQEEYRKDTITLRGKTYDMQIMSDDVFGIPNDDKIPIFCGSLFDEFIIDYTSDSTGVFCEEFRKEIRQFGRYIVCISVQEFVNKSGNHAAKKGYGYQFGKVTYINYAEIFRPALYEDNVNTRLQQFYGMIYKHSGGIIEGCFSDSSELMLFQKNAAYSAQNEWRFVLKDEENSVIPETQDYYTMSIGKLKSARIYDIDDILNATIDLTQ